MAKKTIKDLHLAGKRVFIRVDFNVPQDKQTGEITNTQRITAALPRKPSKPRSNPVPRSSRNCSVAR